MLSNSIMDKSPNEKIRVDHIRNHPMFNIHNGIVYKDFFKIVKALQDRLKRTLHIVELGTRRWIENFPTHHKNEFQVHGIDTSNYTMTDYLDGMDVDKKVDVHKFTSVFPEESVDIIFSASTFEHFKYPWIASHELMKSLKMEGYIYIQTHQTFPLHGYPYDFYRFSRSAMESLYPKEMNMEIVNSWYEFLNEILPTGNVVAESYSNVNIIAKKVGKTPANWIYNF